jgi:hypothetical protein
MSATDYSLRQQGYSDEEIADLHSEHREAPPCRCRPGSPDSCPVCEAREDIENHAETFDHD